MFAANFIPGAARLSGDASNSTKMDGMKPDSRSPWLLYLLECERGTYYAGITTDLERRFAEHVFGIGARYTRAYPPIRVVAVKGFPDRASASRAEAALKKLPRANKVGFFAAPSRTTGSGRTTR